MTERFHIITGGPGSGKSTLIEALAARGIPHRPEAGRAIIRDQVSLGGTALPWADREAFAGLMLASDMRSWREAAAIPGPVLFDRGIPDVVGYLRLCGLPVPSAAMRAAESLRYARQVFLAPHCPAIFQQDAERKQSPEEAEATCRAMTEVYAELGYELIRLPLASVAERVDFVLSHIA
ncbi:AAA family ATPase [Novosphingobium sp.]|uniref:AAA family ATPase n=1 Tax=Novosphingobium sp. TaxID=1874826 RepID=UPI0031DE27DB